MSRDRRQNAGYGKKVRRLARGDTRQTRITTSKSTEIRTLEPILPCPTTALHSANLRNSVQLHSYRFTCHVNPVIPLLKTSPASRNNTFSWNIGDRKAGTLLPPRLLYTRDERPGPVKVMILCSARANQSVCRFELIFRSRDNVAGRCAPRAPW